MVIDTSAILAILLFEPDRESFTNAMLEAETRAISAANVLESGIVLESRRGETAGREFDLFLNQAGFDVIPVDAEQVEIARLAWRRYGKGRHAAALNFGDCFAYALAKVLNEPLLAKGTDFGRTDIECVRIP
jgi:ribonuclease VapC